MTNIEKKNFGHTARNNDDVSEYPEKLEENGAYPHLTLHKPLTVSEFKARCSGVVTDEEVIKAVFEALPDVNSGVFYRNGSVHLRVSPMKNLLHKHKSERSIARKFEENKLLLRDIIQVIDKYGKAAKPNESMISEYAQALAQASICYVDDKYDGKENN